MNTSSQANYSNQEHKQTEFVLTRGTSLLYMNLLYILESEWIPEFCGHFSLVRCFCSGS